MNDFVFKNLTTEIRGLMIEEVEHDCNNYRLYISERLNQKGKEMYYSHLLYAISNGDCSTLQQCLESEPHFNLSEMRNGRLVKVPVTAAQLLAQSEFNRFYIRAICRKMVNENIEMVEIYRARESSWARPESEIKIGTYLPAKLLLDDLRTSIGQQPNVLPEINSGLSIKIIDSYLK